MNLCPNCQAVFVEQEEYCFVDGTALQTGITDADPLLSEELFEGRFQIKGRIGRGLKGRVYYAWHAHLRKAAGRAIKVLDSGVLPGSTNWQRFVQEGQLLDCCEHENIVRIFDAHISSQRAYLVMEFLEGQPLSLLLQAGGLPPARALHLAKQMASGLSHIHKKGVIHRSLSPKNIFVLKAQQQEEPPAEKVKILDFGLARLPDNPLTRASLTIQRRAYVAPEVIRDSVANEISDQYSLGSILYEMLCGRPPRNAADTDGSQEPSPQEMNFQQLRDLCPLLSPAWVATILRMLRDLPEQRYPSMKAVEQALRGLSTAHTPRLFICCSPADNHAADQLKLALAPYLSGQKLTLWTPSMVLPGDGAELRVNQQLDYADAVALLVSSDLWADEPHAIAPVERQLTRIARRFLVEGLRVVPILIRPGCVPEPFHRLAVLPAEGKPILLRRDREEAWIEVARELVRAMGIQLET